MEEEEQQGSQPSSGQDWDKETEEEETEGEQQASQCSSGEKWDTEEELEVLFLQIR